VNPKTGTVYVAIQCVHTDCVPGPPEHVVDIVSTATCNGTDHSGCRVAGAGRPLVVTWYRSVRWAQCFSDETWHAQVACLP
jgi:hypothetical protein